ncbi:cytochrome ubiquinol oxidase subunit I [Candidatus Latescibacterota bacterium]
MDGVLLARLHFTLTVGFHYIFPQLTIGMAWLIIWMVNRRLLGAISRRFQS